MFLEFLMRVGVPFAGALVLFGGVLLVEGPVRGFRVEDWAVFSSDFFKSLLLDGCGFFFYFLKKSSLRSILSLGL